MPLPLSQRSNLSRNHAVAANELEKAAKQHKSSTMEREACYRGAISRAYYAAFSHGRILAEELTEQDPTAYPDGSSKLEHEPLAQWLLDWVSGPYGNNQFALKSLRNSVDYNLRDLEIKDSNGKVITTYPSAEQIYGMVVSYASKLINF